MSWRQPSSPWRSSKQGVVRGLLAAQLSCYDLRTMAGPGLPGCMQMTFKEFTMGERILHCPSPLRLVASMLV